MQWHVAGRTQNTLHLVVHFLVAPGANSAGMTWKQAALNAGLTGLADADASVSPWGDGGEETDIISGDVVELTMKYSLDRTQTLTAQKDDVQEAVDEFILHTQAEWAIRLKWAGYGEGTVE